MGIGCVIGLMVEHNRSPLCEMQKHNRAILEHNPPRTNYKDFLFAETVAATTATPTSPKTPVPSTPTILASPSQSPTSITLSWEQPAGDAVDRYDIVYTYQGGCSDYTQTDNMATVNNGTAREYTLQNLQEISDYTISVAAVNGGGSSPAATATVATTPSGI